jgi:hypothetical protein
MTSGVECDAWSDAGDAAVRADDAGDVRAVAVAVVRQRIRHGNRVECRRIRIRVERVANQVVASPDAAARAEAAAEIGMVVVHARVDDGDLDAVAAQPELALRDVGAGHRERRDERRLDAWLLFELRAFDQRHRIHGLNTGDATELRHLCRGSADGEAVPQSLESPLAGDADAGGCRTAMHVVSFPVERRVRGALREGRPYELDEPERRALVRRLREELGGIDFVKRYYLTRLRIADGRRDDQDERGGKGEQCPHGSPFVPQRDETSRSGSSGGF